MNVSPRSRPIGHQRQQPAIAHADAASAPLPTSTERLYAQAGNWRTARQTVPSRSLSATGSGRCKAASPLGQELSYDSDSDSDKTASPSRLSPVSDSAHGSPEPWARRIERERGGVREPTGQMLALAHPQAVRPSPQPSSAQSFAAFPSLQQWLERDAIDSIMQSDWQARPLALAEVTEQLVLAIAHEPLKVAATGQALLLCLHHHAWPQAPMICSLLQGQVAGTPKAAIESMQAAARGWAAERHLPARATLCQLTTRVGDLATAHGALEQALDLYHFAIRCDGGQVDAWYKIGSLYIDWDIALAKRHADAMSECFGGGWRALFLQASVALRAEHSAEAELYARDAIGQLRGNVAPAALWYLLAKALRAQDKWGDIERLQWRCWPNELTDFIRQLGADRLSAEGVLPACLLPAAS